MNLLDKHKKEVHQQKNQRIQGVLQAAWRIFLRKGIAATPLVDVAREAEVGIATVYRYFNTKPELVIRVAEQMMEQEFSRHSEAFERSLKEASTGMEEVEQIFRLYLFLYDNEKDLLRFIEEFDNYIAGEKIDPAQLTGYARVFGIVEKRFFQACRRGEEDGSIRKKLPMEDIFYGYTKALMGLAQKHVSRSNLLLGDSSRDGRTELLKMVEIVLYYLQPLD